MLPKEEEQGSPGDLPVQESLNPSDLVQVVRRRRLGAGAAWTKEAARTTTTLPINAGDTLLLVSAEAVSLVGRISASDCWDETVAVVVAP